MGLATLWVVLGTDLVQTGSIGNGRALTPDELLIIDAVVIAFTSVYVAVPPSGPAAPFGSASGELGKAEKAASPTCYRRSRRQRMSPHD